MDKKHLQDNILSKPYQREVWHEVLKRVFGVKTLFSPPKNIPLAANEIAKDAVELGNFYTADERLVGIYEIMLRKDARTKLAFNKVGLRNLLRSIYKYDVDGALIVFVQDHKWRFSYVSEIRTEEGKKDTEPKRYTYLFGEGESSRTAADRFFKLIGKPIFLNDLYDAFSVEKLNKDFFKTYKEFYEKGVAHLADNTSYYKILIDKKQAEEDKKQKPTLYRIAYTELMQKEAQ
jgi:adenine-specific DNA-methyltransferase